MTKWVELRSVCCQGHTAGLQSEKKNKKEGSGVRMGLTWRLFRITDLSPDGFKGKKGRKRRKQNQKRVKIHITWRLGEIKWVGEEEWMGEADKILRADILFPTVALYVSENTPVHMHDEVVLIELFFCILQTSYKHPSCNYHPNQVFVHTLPRLLL